MTPGLFCNTNANRDDSFRDNSFRSMNPPFIGKPKAVPIFKTDELPEFSYSPLYLVGNGWSLNYQSTPVFDVVMEGEFPTLETFLLATKHLLAEPVAAALYVVTKLLKEKQDGINNAN